MQIVISSQLGVPVRHGGALFTTTRRYCVAYMGTRPARLGAARAGAEIFSYNY